MISDELRKELRDALPEGHPILAKVDTQIKSIVIATKEEITKADYQFTEMVVNLIDKLDDWRRGIRDWCEVERELELVRDEVSEVQT